MNWLNYLNPVNTNETMTEVVIYFVVGLLANIICVVYFISTIIRIKRNLGTLKGFGSFIFAEIGIILWPTGDLLGDGVVRILTNNNYQMFSDTNNIFLSTGITLSVVFITDYLVKTLKTNRLKEKEKLLAHRFMRVAAIITVCITITLTIRFLCLGFLNEKQIANSAYVSYFAIIFLTAIIVTMLVFAFYQLRNEYKNLTSKLNRVKIRIFSGYFIAILLVLLNIILYLILFLVVEGDFGRYFFSSMPILILNVPAILSIYYGLFIPERLQKRLGLLPDFEPLENS